MTVTLKIITKKERFVPIQRNNYVVAHGTRQKQKNLEPVNLKPLYYKLARLERCLTDLPTFAAGPY